MDKKITKTRCGLQMFDRVHAKYSGSGFVTKVVDENTVSVWLDNYPYSDFLFEDSWLTKLSPMHHHI